MTLQTYSKVFQVSAIINNNITPYHLFMSQLCIDLYTENVYVKVYVVFELQIRDHS